MTIVQRAATPALGSRVPNVEWSEKTSGAAEYADDIKPEGLLHASVLRSPHPHAEILSVDVSAALRLPGVVAIVTGADLPDQYYIHHGGHLSDRRVLARDRVRFIGEEVAAVAATSRQQAAAARAAIKVRYRRLPAMTTVAAARAPKAAPIHAAHPDNVALGFTQSFGNPNRSEPGLVAVSGHYSFPRQNHACMETNSIVAHWRKDSEELHVWVSTQAPYFVEKELAHVLELDRDQIIVHEVAVGGGFGSKSKISEYEAIAATLSMRSGRPVRLALTRDEEFATTKSRHRFEISMQTYARPDGMLVARDADVVVENGAYNHSGPSVMGAGTGALASLYDVPSVELAASLVFTNVLPGGQFRGYGNPQATFAVESQMDELAYKLGIDPFDFRIQNANRAGQRTHVGYQLGSAALVECLEAARDAIGWEDKKHLAGSGRGIGVAAAIQVSGAYVYPGANKSSAAIDIDRKGRVCLRFGGADAGTGQRTMLAQVVSDELQVPIEQVQVSMMHSRNTPTDLGAWSTRGTYMSAHAAAGASALARDDLRSRAARLMEVSAGLVELRDGHWHGPAGALSLAEVIARSDGELSVEFEYTAAVEEMDWATGTGNISGAYSFAAHAVEVEVDPDTGRVRVVDYVAAHDSGEVLNPLLAESQVVGGVVMGVGAALGEELLFEQGRQINGSYLNYPLPRAADVPRIRPIFVAGSDPNAPYGAKGVGEIVLVPSVAAVGNAIAHATGVRIRSAPFTPDKVLPAWREVRGEGASRRYGIWRRPSRWQIAAFRAAYPRGLHRMLDRYGTRFARVPEATPATGVVKPTDLDGASAALAEPGTRAIGGGTDLVPGQGRGKQALGTLVDLTLVPALARISEQAGEVRIGGAVRLSDLARAEGLGWDGVIGGTIRRIASAQVREMATVAGNLCQEKRCWFYQNDFTCYKRGGTTCPCYAVDSDHRFYHAVTDAHRCQAVTPSDLATTLHTLDAGVHLRGPNGVRVVPITRFYTGPGETCLSKGEFITDLVIPRSPLTWSYAFDKLDLYSGGFAVVAACAGVGRDAGGTIRDARLTLGAVGPVPLRLPMLERDLVAAPPVDRGQVRSLAHRWGTRAHPLKNNGWKVDAAAGVLARAIAEALEMPKV